MHVTVICYVTPRGVVAVANISGKCTTCICGEGGGEEGSRLL